MSQVGISYFLNFNLLPFQTLRGRYFLRVSFYLEMVDKMWQGVIDSLDVVSCSYLLTLASSHCEGGVISSSCEHSCFIKNSENFSNKLCLGLKSC